MAAVFDIFLFFQTCPYFFLFFCDGICFIWHFCCLSIIFMKPRVWERVVAVQAMTAIDIKKNRTVNMGFVSIPVFPSRRISWGRAARTTVKHDKTDSFRTARDGVVVIHIACPPCISCTMLWQFPGLQSSTAERKGKKPKKKRVGDLWSSLWIVLRQMRQTFKHMSPRKAL